MYSEDTTALSQHTLLYIVCKHGHCLDPDRISQLGLELGSSHMYNSTNIKDRVVCLWDIYGVSQYVAGSGQSNVKTIRKVWKTGRNLVIIYKLATWIFLHSLDQCPTFSLLWKQMDQSCFNKQDMNAFINIWHGVYQPVLSLLSRWKSVFSAKS